MPHEIRTSRAKITIELSASLRAKFNKYAKKLNTSMSQLLRDHIQGSVKKTK